MAKEQLKVNCEVIDLVSILPWDKETVCKVSWCRPIEVWKISTIHRICWHTIILLHCDYSRRKRRAECWWPTKLHWPMVLVPNWRLRFKWVFSLIATAEYEFSKLPIVSQDECFLHLEAPVQRVTGWDTPFPHVFEPFYLPDKYRCFSAIKKLLNYWPIACVRAMCAWCLTLNLVKNVVATMCAFVEQ